MTQKEEIEQLAIEYANGKSSSDVFKDAHKNDFIKGYTQCQENIADKKYTEEDMLKAFEYGKIIEPFDCFEDFINSLNKQDNESKRKSHTTI